jgi:hypothetical protein
VAVVAGGSNRWVVVTSTLCRFSFPFHPFILFSFLSFLSLFFFCDVVFGACIRFDVYIFVRRSNVGFRLSTVLKYLRFVLCVFGLF